MMRALGIWQRLAVLVMLLATACGRGKPQDSVLLWHAYSDAELKALTASVKRIEKEHDLRVMLVSVPYESFADKLTAAIPNGNGPDLFIFAHDRIGHWTANQLIEPIEFYVDDVIADRFAYEAINAMSYDDSLYGLPLTVKSVALFYRTDIVKTPPTETDQLFDMSELYVDDFKGYPLVYENTDLYAHAAWLHGFGGSLFTAEGRQDLATPAAVSALEFARRLDREKIVPGGVDGKMVATLFGEGKAAMAISGPWFQSSIGTSVPWAVTTLPIVSATGKRAAPFLGAEGVLMSSKARDKQRAFRVMNALTADSEALHRARDAGQVVPNQAAYRADDLASNAALMTFRSQLDHSVPMSAAPGMRSVWTPYQTALLKVIDQQADPADALRSAEKEVRTYDKERN